MPKPQHSTALDAVIDNSPAILYARKIANIFEFTYISNPIKKISGLTPEQLINQKITWLHQIHPEDRKRIQAALNSIPEIHQTTSIEYRIITQDGRIIWLLDQFTVIHNETANTQQIEGILIDITSIKQQELNLINANQAAKKTNEEKNKFLTNMSHELRIPLNSILGFAQLLQMCYDKPLNQKRIDFVNQIMKSGEHLLNLINEILDLSNIESGTLPIAIQKTNISLIINECIEISKNLAQKYSVSIINQSASKGLPLISVDPNRFKQILLNILSNAIKYNNAGGSVIIHSELTSQRLKLSITDTGNGIPSYKTNHLFQPFSRLGVEATDIEGTGIGLITSKKLAELMNGDIGYLPNEDKGSTFWIEFPLSEKSITQNDLISSRINHHADKKHKHNILYIEDNPSNLILMEAILKSVNINMLSAHNAEFGLEIAELNQPDVIFMDINLPGINGYEALKKLKSSTKTQNIPVIAISADASPLNIANGINAGFIKYITKPFGINIILDTIRPYCFLKDIDL